MAKLNQIIAVDKGIKARVYGDVTILHKASQKAELFNGMSKTFQAVDDDGEKLPPESKRVQYVASEVLRTMARLTSELFAVSARREWTNTVAKADIKVGEHVLIHQVPAPYLLFLEKQLNDIHTFVTALPTLDIAEDWQKDPNSGLYKTQPAQTHRTKKVQRPIVLYNATPEHPAQTQMITEDVISGWWTLVKQSGAMPVPEKEVLLKKVQTLIRAVKEAREEANMHEETKTPDVGAIIFTYLLGE